MAHDDHDELTHAPAGLERPVTSSPTGPSRRTILRGAGALGIGVGLAAGGMVEPADALASTPGGDFPLVTGRRAAPLVVSGRDHPGVIRVVSDLREDIHRVADVTPTVWTDQIPEHDAVVIVGTVGVSPLIDTLVSAGKLDVTAIQGKWEASLREVVTDPAPGVRRALVIAGSDQRGTIFGTYDVSRLIGVSPWYFWADVPPRRQHAISIPRGRHVRDQPAVKYRGFFINDENPDLGTWVPEFFGPGLAPGFPGGFNRKFYARVFELMLRLSANYLWPAVWGRAFAEDDPLNHATATEYGIIMGTSHEAPMLRGIEEWNRHAVPAVRDADGNIVTPGHDPYGGTGEWSFRFNAEAIMAYWRDGIRRMVDESIEGVVTIGMRGNGDTALPDGDGIDLMESIVSAERQIIGEVTGQDVATVPQVWTLYKEVQRYWDKGMPVPDDVTLVFADDNWGNIRKLPDPALPARAGGYGIYYHYDYVGGGRSYKWVDTNSLPNIWEQLNLAYSYGVDRLWMVNVGDLKGVELPLEFLLDYAWDPDSLPIERVPDWERRWVERQFGPRHARDIAAVLHTYAHLQAQRKPELLNRLISLDGNEVVYDDQASPYSLTNYRELDTVTQRWRDLAEAADRIGRRLPRAQQDAYLELVGYRVAATANLYELRRAEFTNIRYARQGRAATNHLADVAEARFADDLAMARRYNERVAGGKWHGFQSQPHIDYGDVERYGPDAPWQQPQIDNVAIPDVIFPAVRRVQLPHRAEMGVAVEGSAEFWPERASLPALPALSPYQGGVDRYLEVFNRGSVPFDYRISPAVDWVRVSHRTGRVDDQVRATVTVDWRRAPTGRTEVPITVTGPDGARAVLRAVVDNPVVPRRQIRGHVESDGHVSIEAEHATRTVTASGIRWRRIPDIGRTGSGMAPFPVTAPRQSPTGRGPRLEYEVTLFTTGQVTVWAYLSPRNNALHADGIEYAVSFDDAAPQVVNITTAEPVADDGVMNRAWERNTSDNVNRTATTHTIATPGRHVLVFWMVDPTVVVQKLIIDTGGMRTSYLGPPESLRV